MTHPKLLSHDPDDAALLAQVSPSGWQNPKASGRYQLLVIGAGPAGLVAAAGAAGLGARVALVERDMMGGDCLIFGCVPSKALLRTAQLAHRARSSQGYGLRTEGVEVELAAALARLRRVRSELAQHDAAERFRRLGVDVFFGAASFASEDSLLVGEQRLHFQRAVIATGARASRPPIRGLDQVPYHTNETIFSLSEIPESLVVLGAGPIGCELGQAFVRLGSRVCLVDNQPRLLPRDDARASRVIAAQFEREGIELWLGEPVREVRRTSSGILVVVGRAERAIETKALLVATGRRPDLAGLNLERAGIELDDYGVKVDDRLRTTNPRVYAAGDVCSRLQFTHAADAMARMVLQNALFFGRKRVSDLTVPWVTYTAPEVAHVGMSDAEAQAAGKRVQSYGVDMSAIDRGVIDGDTGAYCRIHVDARRGTLLGATMVAERAGEAIGELALAISQRLTVSQLAATVHPYPTGSEGWKRAADAWSRSRLTPGVARLLRWWLALFGRFG